MESTSRPSGRTSPGTMTRPAFSRRVDKLLADGMMTLAEAIRQTAWEENHPLSSMADQEFADYMGELDEALSACDAGIVREDVIRRGEAAVAETDRRRAVVSGRSSGETSGSYAAYAADGPQGADRRMCRCDHIASEHLIRLDDSKIFNCCADGCDCAEFNEAGR